MKKIRVARVDFSDGEIHFILEEFVNAEYSEHYKDFDITEIKII